MTEAGIRNHAMLFAFLARHTLARCGEAGAAALREGVIRYGEQRGRRMARRAAQDGMPLDAASYLLYGEWQAAAGETDFHAAQYEPRVELVSTVCPWFATWREAGMLAEGAYYCRDVDAALARGFGGPALCLDSNLVRGDGCCAFHFEGPALDAAAQQRLARDAQRLGSRAKLDWDYHTAHLLAVLREAILTACGADGEAAVAGALADYAALFGAPACERLRADAEADFEALPPYAGIETSA